MRIFKSFDTPGKGVSKNEREKRGFFRFFELFFRNFWVLVSADLWFVLTSLPIVTLGLSNVGLAYICRMAARDKHVFVASDFFDTIKKNWKRALPLGIINLILDALAIFNIITVALWMRDGVINRTYGWIVLLVTAFLFVLYSFAKFYQYTLMITFDYKLGAIIKNSLLFATVGIKHNLIIGGVLVLVYFLAFVAVCINWKFGIALITLVGIFLFPQFRMFLIQFNVFPEIKKFIIDPYYAEHPDEDIEKRRALGVLDEDEDIAVFDDEESLRIDQKMDIE
ncbi:MAG: DUF624 domain-containing protein [Ruminococcaceae bacterium]|nr:DUF624 domain-containing protein [Oscillospiraceae bacterium]